MKKFNIAIYILILTILLLFTSCTLNTPKEPETKNYSLEEYEAKIQELEGIIEQQEKDFQHLLLKYQELEETYTETVDDLTNEIENLNIELIKNKPFESNNNEIKLQNVRGYGAGYDKGSFHATYVGPNSDTLAMEITASSIVLMINYFINLSLEIEPNEITISEDLKTIKQSKPISNDFVYLDLKEPIYFKERDLLITNIYLVLKNDSEVDLYLESKDKFYVKEIENEKVRKWNKTIRTFIATFGQSIGNEDFN